MKRSPRHRPVGALARDPAWEPRIEVADKPPPVLSTNTKISRSSSKAAKIKPAISQPSLSACGVCEVRLCRDAAIENIVKIGISLDGLFALFCELGMGLLAADRLVLGSAWVDAAR